MPRDQRRSPRRSPAARRSVSAPAAGSTNSSLSTVTVGPQLHIQRNNPRGDTDRFERVWVPREIYGLRPYHLLRLRQPFLLSPRFERRREQQQPPPPPTEDLSQGRAWFGLRPQRRFDYRSHPIRRKPTSRSQSQGQLQMVTRSITRARESNMTASRLWYKLFGAPKRRRPGLFGVRRKTRNRNKNLALPNISTIGKVSPEEKISVSDMAGPSIQISVLLDSKDGSLPNDESTMEVVSNGTAKEKLAEETEIQVEQLNQGKSNTEEIPSHNGIHETETPPQEGCMNSDATTNVQIPSDNGIQTEETPDQQDCINSDAASAVQILSPNEVQEIGISDQDDCINNDTASTVQILVHNEVQTKETRDQGDCINSGAASNIQIPDNELQTKETRDCMHSGATSAVQIPCQTKDVQDQEDCINDDAASLFGRSTPENLTPPVASPKSLSEQQEQKSLDDDDGDDKQTTSPKSDDTTREQDLNSSCGSDNNDISSNEASVDEPAPGSSRSMTSTYESSANSRDSSPVPRSSSSSSDGRHAFNRFSNVSSDEENEHNEVNHNGVYENGVEMIEVEEVISALDLTTSPTHQHQQEQQQDQVQYVSSDTSSNSHSINLVHLPDLEVLPVVSQSPVSRVLELCNANAFREALELCDQLLSNGISMSNNDHQGLLEARARSHYHLTNYTSAIRDAKLLISLDKTNKTACEIWFLASFYLGHVDECDSAHKNSGDCGISFTEDVQRSMKAYSDWKHELNNALNLTIGGHPDVAFDRLADIEEIKQFDFEVNMFRADLLYQMGKPVEATKLFTHAVNTGNYEAGVFSRICYFYTNALYHFVEGRLHDAMEHFHQCVRRVGTSPSYLYQKYTVMYNSMNDLMKIHYVNDRNYDVCCEVLNILNKVRQKSGVQNSFPYQMAQLEMSLLLHPGNCVEQLGILDGLIRDFPEVRVATYKDRGELYAQIQMYQEAAKDFQKYLDLSYDLDQAEIQRVANILEQIKVMWFPTRRTWYHVLGVGTQASTTEISKAFRTLALIHHPDKCVGESVEHCKQREESMKEINEAYRILSIPETRNQYDIDEFIPMIPMQTPSRSMFNRDGAVF